MAQTPETSTETKTMEPANGGEQNPRETFTGKRLTDIQFAESMLIADCIRREIEHSGRFKEKLADYAYAFSRTEKFDAQMGENIIRNQFSDRNGQTMNSMRERLVEQEEKIKEDPHAKNQALHHARNIETHIKEGNSMPFYRAIDKEAVAFARLTRITETGAKKMMSATFEAETGKKLYDHGKELEKEHYIPKLEAEKAARAEQRQSQQNTQIATG